MAIIKGKPLKKNPESEFYYRLVLAKQVDGYTATPIGFDKSVPYTLVKANALFIAPIGIAEYQLMNALDLQKAFKSDMKMYYVYNL